MKIILSKAPPSINHIYGYTSKGGYARSYITKEGKAWFDIAAQDIKKQFKKTNPIESELEIDIDIYLVRYSIRDVDNVLKPILDSLQKNNVIANDNKIYRLTVEKHKCKIEDERVEISLMGF